MSPSFIQRDTRQTLMAHFLLSVGEYLPIFVLNFPTYSVYLYRNFSTTSMIVGQEPTAFAEGAGGGGWWGGGVFGHFFLPLRETARYRLKYCLKGPFHQEKKTTSTVRVELVFYVHGKHLRSCRDGTSTSCT